MHSPPRPPHEHSEGKRGPFRVSSPLRPPRPSSITESVLNVMSQGSGRGSNLAEASLEHGLAPITLALRRNPNSLNDDDGDTVDTVVPNTDNSNVYDGTRKKNLRTVLEHGMPLEQLTQPSVRVANRPRRSGIPRSSYHPEPLRIHKRSASNADSYSNRNCYITNLEETEYPSPVLAEDELIASVKRRLWKTPPLDGAVPEHTDSLADASSEEGSFTKNKAIAQERDESLAALEGRPPEIYSSEWSPRSGRSEYYGIFGRQTSSRVRSPISEETVAARPEANDIDEDVINQWI
jgi:hypothetical protein